jgi:O-succinylbenzoic acid--CoA ligase
MLGAQVRVHPRFDPAAVSAEPDVAFVSVVPTMLVRLLDAGVDLARFRTILVGGAHLPDDLRSRAEAAGARIVETYGLTESCGGVVYEGRPLSGLDVRILDGEVQLRGSTLMRGYRFDTDATRRAFAPGGWLRTGDAGEMDAAGRLRVLGRTDGVIRTGGEKVWPQEVETALRDHPKVAAIAVGSRPDLEWGERVVAFVVPRDPADPPTLEDLRALATGRLPRHKAPRELVLVRELPRTGSGKIRRVGFPNGNTAGLSSMEAPGASPGASDGDR